MRDEELITLLISKDINGLKILYSKYAGALFGIIYRAIQDKGEAEELLQEVFMQIWQNAVTYDNSKCRFFIWIMCITRDFIEKSKDKHTQNRYDQFNFTVDLPFDEFSQIKPKESLTIYLLFTKANNHKAIAERLNLSIDSLRSKIRLSILELRHFYSEKRN